jgi:3-dehydrosphinganine reductase
MSFTALFTDHFWELVTIVISSGIAVPVVSFLTLIGLSFTLLKVPISPKKVQGKHILVVGASSGLGKAVALEVARLGASKVTLTARGTDSDSQGKSRLDYAVEEVKSSLDSSSTVVVSSAKFDVSNKEQTQGAMNSIISENGPIDWVIVCSGNAEPFMFVNDDSSASNVEERMMKVNFMGPVNVIKGLLFACKEQAGNEAPHYPSKVLLVSSLAALFPIPGYAAYGSSKAALKGLAEVLRTELRLYDGIQLQVYFPSNLDTPGLAKENETKPELTKQIEGIADTIPAKVAAQTLLTGMGLGWYMYTGDLVGVIACAISNNMSPRYFKFLQILAAPIFVIVSEAVALLFEHEVRTFKNKQKTSN